MANSTPMDTVQITKKEAASLSLDAAIQLLFAGGDIVAVHTLAGAGARTASDWYAACNLDALGASFEHRAVVKRVIGGSNKRTISYQLAVGRRELRGAMQAAV